MGIRRMKERPFLISLPAPSLKQKSIREQWELSCHCTSCHATGCKRSWEPKTPFPSPWGGALLHPSAMCLRQRPSYLLELYRSSPGRSFLRAPPGATWTCRAWDGSMTNSPSPNLHTQCRMRGKMDNVGPIDILFRWGHGVKLCLWTANHYIISYVVVL